VIANKPAVLSNGAWVLPFWREPGRTCPVLRTRQDQIDQVNSSAGVLVTEDQGMTWVISGKLTQPQTWLIENSVVELHGHSLMQLFRTKLGALAISFSYDGGLSWSIPQHSDIPNPDSKVHLLRLGGQAWQVGGSAGGSLEGALVLAYNRSPRYRSPLVISVSQDEGRTWRMLADVEPDPEVQYAYPTMVDAGDALHVAYAVMHPDPAYKLLSQGIKMASIRKEPIGPSPGLWK
ncbi:hypothetical protein CYMTET_49439, partial [Cymbomonas tetramitiformis]